MPATTATKIHAETKQQTIQLAPDEAAHIEWFFDEGIATFERSNLGPQLERLRSASRGTYECRTCKGRRFVKVRLATCGHCRGTGWLEPTNLVDTQQRCGHCKGKCVVRLAPESKRTDYYTVKDLCAPCRGTGVTARKRGHQRRTGAMTARPGVIREWRAPVYPDEYDVERYGMVARRLMRMTERHALAIYAYHWIGQQYAANVNTGPLWAVMALTVAGRRLVERNSDKPPKALDGHQLQLHSRAQDHADIDGSCVDPGLVDDWQLLTQPELFTELSHTPSDGGSEARQRTALLAAAKRQAETLYRAAVLEWQTLGDGQVARSRARTPKAPRTKATTLKDVRALLRRLEVVEVVVR